MTTSWDCFDTLVARRKFDPLTVFDDMGECFDLKDFRRKRKEAESRAPYTLDTIYDQLAPAMGWSNEQKEHYKRKEIEAEIHHCIPIQENINAVKDGDIIVSDMYLPREAIEAILRKNGLTKAVQFYVTTGGKSSGSIWKSLPKISLHVGDNVHSDVASPKRHGIEARHDTLYQYSDLEKIVGGQLKLLMRAVRLANPYEPGTPLYTVWKEQSQLNIPALVLASSLLPPKNLAFIYRDCVHLHRIHDQLHGTQNTAFHCSRVALKRKNPQWREYAENVTRGKIIVDLQGTGGSIIKYWQEEFKEMPSLAYVTGTLAHGKLLVPTRHDAIERFNSCKLGTMMEFPERLECEYKPEVLEAQYGAIDCCIEHMKALDLKPIANKLLLECLIELMFWAHTPAINTHCSDHETPSNNIPWPADRPLEDRMALNKVFGL